ncbi:OmpA family protein [Cognatazoarcus halotolerans]|uniref:OmpA family protein n=1 Tax=Cognatazoarcus halotolerans TaxID=2686016 RepID=UPI00135C479D|nr:OmpA family protein [Cognatazoarcus halotolerans]MCB1900614.1 OmpA family protein [Rhodocyclaceae bacterium]MCP5310535.1 OmpA family protein [Zoogloeaceae bacterium]
MRRAMRRLAGLAAVMLALVARAGTPPNLLVQESGARVAGFSSAAGGADLDVLLPPRALLEQAGVDLNDFVWCSADQAPFPHWVLFEFRRRQWLTTLVFNNALNDEMAYPGIAARHVEVWVGSERPDRLTRVASFELERNRNDQAVQIAPVEARWLKFVITGNWGNDTWTELAAFAAYDDGSRPAGLAAALRRDGKVDVYGIYFDFASATLRHESGPALQEILAFHAAEPQRRLIIEGHTDARGSVAANSALSAARARAVLAELVRHGADERRLEAVGRGASQPVADNASSAGRARNRRVTVRLAAD